MPVATTPTASPRPSTLSKMEDRKRPAIGAADELAPPSKRIAVNGSKAKDDALDMKEESWVEVCALGPVFSSLCHTAPQPSMPLRTSRIFFTHQHVSPRSIFSEPCSGTVARC